MKFGPIPIQDCVGGIVAHSFTADGVTFKKGHKLTGPDIRKLALEGIREITVALPEPDDLEENEAAANIGTALFGKNMTLSDAATGRINLYADAHGLLVLDETTIHAINNLDERITLATLPHMETVRPGQMIATVKIIPFALPRTLVENAASIAKNKAPLKIWPFRKHAVGLIQTRYGGSPDKTHEKVAKRLSDRLKQYGSKVTLRVACAHQEDAIAKAIRGLMKNRCDLLIIFGASAISDRKDVVPMAIRTAGGNIERLGMPVDPGNLLLLADLDGTPVIGAPGCAKSPKLNGFDWVLERSLAGMKPKHADIALMGPGGLLKEIPSRPSPRHSGRGKTGKVIGKKVIALILAAGQSRRMGKTNKLLSKVKNKPMLMHVINSAHRSKAHSSLLITGHNKNEIKELSGNIKSIYNANFLTGMGSSIGAGVGALPDDATAALILLGDMPHVTPDIIDRLIEAYDPGKGDTICIPTCHGKRGNPVLFDRIHFDALLTLNGDQGAKKIIEENEDNVREVAIDDPAIFLDIDTEEALRKVINSPDKAG